MKSNQYRAIFFEKPDYIPIRIYVNEACWHHYPQEWLIDQMLKHPLLFPNFKPPKLPYTPGYAPTARKGLRYKDHFGCIWDTADDGIDGTIVGHPLEDWDAFDSYVFPDPEHSTGLYSINWDNFRKDVEAAKARGEMASGGLRHGHTFLQLSGLRGYSNLLFDMADEEPKLFKLIEGVEEFNHYIIKKYLDLGADIVGFAEDLGMQVGPMLSPEYFRKYIKPSYSRMMKSARDKGVPVHMHSDGDIRTLVDDLVDSGVVVINLQDLVNGIDWIKERFRGKMCVELDIDRQNITVFGTPKDIDEMIRYEVESLGSPDGGLMMVFGLYPGTPKENVVAVMDAMEKYATYFS